MSLWKNQTLKLKAKIFKVLPKTQPQTYWPIRGQNQHDKSLAKEDYTNYRHVNKSGEWYSPLFISDLLAFFDTPSTE